MLNDKKKEITETFNLLSEENKDIMLSLAKKAAEANTPPRKKSDKLLSQKNDV